MEAQTNFSWACHRPLDLSLHLIGCDLGYFFCEYLNDASNPQSKMPQCSQGPKLHMCQLLSVHI